MTRYPVRVTARRDESLSRWLWLVKWLLLIPHILALLVLWTGLVVLTAVAYLAVLFTGRYPAPIRAYNLGVLRWTWRVGYYGYQALGTDQYPPFTLADVPEHPARLEADEGAPPPRWMPLVAWVFAIPHLIILGALTGAATWSLQNSDGRTAAPISVVGAGLLIAGLSLLFTGRYPTGLHDLLVGVARWNLRVAAYLMLLTPRYPPFRLDQGGDEPDDAPAGPSAVGPPGQRGTAAGPVTALVAGVLLLAPGTGLGVGGGALLAVDAARDSTGYVTSPTLRLDSPTAAITADGLTITDAGRWTRDIADIGGLRIAAAAPAGAQVFVGIAPQQDVDTWLAGVARDELTGVRSGIAQYDRNAGAVQAAASPAAQRFWVASATGTGNAELRWQVTDGKYAVVVANADGAPGVSVDVRGAVQVPGLAGLGAGLLTAGAVLGLIAIGLIVLGGVGLGRRHSGPSTTAEPQAPPPDSGPAGPAPSATPVGARR